jgi:hypothetical protein
MAGAFCCLVIKAHFAQRFEHREVRIVDLIKIE